MGNNRGGRAISPVTGVVLLVAIVVVLVSGAAAAIFDLTQERESQPEVALEMEVEDDGFTHALELTHGSALDGDKVTLRGAADPDALSGTELSASDDVQILPIEEEIKVVYTGEHGSSYLLRTFEPDQTFPDPDEGCEWVETESDGGTEKIKVTGIVVNCDLETIKDIEVESYAVVIGNVDSDNNQLDADDVKIYGDVDVEDVANLQDGEIKGSVVSQTADVKIGNGTVGGSIEAGKVIEVVDGSSVDGDLTNDDKTVKVDDSTVSGSIVTEGDVKLQDATIEGDVYVDPADFDCTSSTINGEDCSTYTPKDPDDA